MKTWQERRAEDSYLSQLDQMLVQRLRQSEPILSRFKRPQKQVKTPNQISIEINEELDRLESLVRES
jgi:hypothetical protein